jgi:drug/metabolite transporter (DMT)-like permease
MFLLIDTWLLPAIAAGSSSYMVCLLWEQIRRPSAPGWLLSLFLAVLSLIMGGISAFYRYALFGTTLENNIIVMFFVGASTTFFWLLLRKYLPRFDGRGKLR